MKRDIRLTALLLAIIVVSLIALVGWKVWASRERTLHEAYVHSLNLTQALDTYAEGIVRQSSTLLLGFMERLEAEGTGPEQMKRLHALADQQQLLMSQLNGIVIYDAAGNWLMSSNGEVPANANSGDRAFFLFHRDNPTREVHIGPPIRSRATGAWVITVSRRFEDAPGHFAGVVAVTLGVENFLRLFGKIDVGTEGAIALTFTNGQMLVRYPFREQDMTHDFSGSPIYTQYLAGTRWARRRSRRAWTGSTACMPSARTNTCPWSPPWPSARARPCRPGAPKRSSPWAWPRRCWGASASSGTC